MRFDNFWALITELVRLDLKTPKRRKEFSVLYDLQHDLVKVRPSTTHIRNIPKSEFQKIWNLARNSVNPYAARQYHKVTWHSSYIVSIMKHITKDEKIE